MSDGRFNLSHLGEYGSGNKITPSSARLSTPEYGKFHKKLAVFFGISL